MAISIERKVYLKIYREKYRESIHKRDRKVKDTDIYKVKQQKYQKKRRAFLYLGAIDLSIFS